MAENHKADYADRSGKRDKKIQKDATRRKILDAAKEVFGEYAYKAASIRMIGKRARIDHPLISYYFPSKAVLFEAVLTDIIEHFNVAAQEWYKGIAKMGLSRGLSVFFDRILDYYQKYPEHFRILVLNAVQSDEKETIPGYDQIQKLIIGNFEISREQLLLRGPKHKLEMFANSVNALLICHLGANDFFANLYGMTPDSIEYLNWVKDSLMFLFLPRLNELYSSQE